MSLVATGSTVYGLGKAAGISLGGVTDFLGFGGGAKCTDEDLSRRDEIQQKISQLLTPQERQRLVGYANSNISPTPREMANFAIGGVNKWGGDCHHKNVGSGDQRFLDALESMLNSKLKSRQSRGQNAGGSAGSGTPSTAGFMKYGRWIVAGIVALIIGYLLNQG